MDDFKKQFNETINLCFLPQLKENFDTMHLKTEDLQTYYENLQVKLPPLFNILQQSEFKEFLKKGYYTQEAYSTIVVFLCELTALQSFMQMLPGSLEQNAKLLLSAFEELDNNIEEIIFQYYQNHLSHDGWKRQLGAIHSFINFLEFKCNTLKSKFSTNWLNLCLSVALNIHECVDPVYKQIALRMFIIILDNSDSTEIKNRNIHNVIYNIVSKNIYNTESFQLTFTTWYCLCKCLENDDTVDTLKWNKRDDLLERIITNVAFSTNIELCRCLLTYIIKLGLNSLELEAKLSMCLKENNIEEARKMCVNNFQATNFRCAKKILDMLIMTFEKINQSDISEDLLLPLLHNCYMIFILPIPLHLISPHLFIFLDKFTVLLLKVFKDQSINLNILTMVERFINTIHIQLFYSPINKEIAKVKKYCNAFENLLNHIDKGTQ